MTQIRQVALNSQHILSVLLSLQTCVWMRQNSNEKFLTFWAQRQLQTLKSHVWKRGITKLGNLEHFICHVFRLVGWCISSSSSWKCRISCDHKGGKYFFRSIVAFLLLVTLICADSLAYLVTILVMRLSRSHSRLKNNNKNAAAQHNSEVAVKTVKIMDYNFTFQTAIALLNLNFLKIFQLFFS